MGNVAWKLLFLAVGIWLGCAGGEEQLPRPKNFRITDRTATSLTVQWDMPNHAVFEESGKFSLRLHTGFRDKYDPAPGGDLVPTARTFVYRNLKPSTTYYLKIQALLNGQRTAATTDGGTRSESVPTPSSTQAKRCEEYAGHVCSQLLGGGLVYVENTTDQMKMEAVASDALGALAGASDDCLKLGSLIICQWVFKPCYVQEWVNSGFRSAVPRPICQEDCDKLKDVLCADVWLNVESIFQENRPVVLNSSCEEDLPRANGGAFPECVSFGALEEKSPRNATACYYGKGEAYQGTIHHTITELKEAEEETCKSWVHGNDSEGIAQMLGLSLQQAKNMKNFCRNPQGRGSRPWCYTAGPKRWAYCSETLRRCGEDVVCEELRSGHICKHLPGFTRFPVYIETQLGKTQARVHWQLEDAHHSLSIFVDKFSEVPNDCVNSAASMICYMSLPLCVRNVTSGAPAKRPVCREYCEEYKQKESCQRVVEELQKSFMDDGHSTLDLTFLNWPISCEELPLKNGGSYPECVDDPDKNWDDGTSSQVNASEACYWQKKNGVNDSGVTYRGTVAITENGLECQHWNSNHPHLIPFDADTHQELKENYCRNPDRRSDRPWCYTTDPVVRWEKCNIKKCDPAPPSGTDNAGENLTNSESRDDEQKETGSMSTTVVTVVGSIAGVFVIVVCITTILYVLHRRKTAAVRSTSLPVSLMALNRARTNSSAIENNPYYTLQERLSCPEVEPEKVVFVDELGEGNFGKVFKGLVEGLGGNEGTATVAIKTLKADSNDQLRKEFFHEAQLMSNFNHKNIVKLLGVCVENSATLCMLFEFMELGDLNSYLREHVRHHSSSDACTSKRGYYYSTTTTTAEMLESCSSESAFELPLDAEHLIHIAVQIAAGMYYLAHRRYVHRDLATRNCLVSHGLTVKIADFGMSQDIYSTDYYRVGGAALLPVRWMPPEAIVYGKFTVESDVWSFGVVMWEIFSFAIQPYYGLSNEEVADAVRRGRQLSCPEGCPPPAYTLMKECWNMEPEERPSFKKLYRRLSDWGTGNPARRLTTLTSSVTTCEERSPVPESDEGHDEVFEQGGLRVELPPVRNGKLPSDDCQSSSQVANGHIGNGHTAIAKVPTTTLL